MTYALRKLIAFVFLGLLVVAFALFWPFIPMVVVCVRRRRRVRRNRKRYAKWLEEGGVCLQTLNSAPLRLCVR